VLTRWTQGAAIAVGVLLLQTAAQAADPGFCERYARTALNQVRRGYESPGCAGRIGGNRWSNDYGRHYEWCLHVPYGAAESERETRRRILDRCSYRG